MPEIDYLPVTKYKLDVNDFVSNISRSLFRNPEDVDILFKFTNNYYNILHILPDIYRFILNCKCDSTDQCRGNHTTSELKGAEAYLIRLVQGLEFKEEIRSLKRESRVPPSCKIRYTPPPLFG